MTFIFPYRLVILAGIILLLTMVECGPGKRQEIKAESGIEYMDYCKSCLFFTPKVGLMGGKRGDCACLWKTIDGGRNWRQKWLPGYMISDLTERDGVIYATVYQWRRDMSSFTYSVYTSCDQGESWEWKCNMKTEESLVDVLVVDNKRMFMVLDSGLLETRNGGRNWQTLWGGDWQMLRDNGQKISMDDNYLYYSVYRVSPDNVPIHYIVRRSLESDKEDSLRLPAGDRVEAICGNIAILREKPFMTYRIEEDMSLTFLGLLKQSAFSVEYISRCGEQLFVNMQTSSLGFKNFYSPDGGRHWKYVNRSESSVPISILSDSKHVWTFVIENHNSLLSYRYKRILSD